MHAPRNLSGAYRTAPGGGLSPGAFMWATLSPAPGTSTCSTPSSPRPAPCRRGRSASRSRPWSSTKWAASARETASTPRNVGAGGAWLGPLAQNGGLTRTHPIGWLSPASNGGDGAFCDAGPDQRGYPYVGSYAMSCDVGSFEFQLFATPYEGRSVREAPARRRQSMTRAQARGWAYILHIESRLCQPALAPVSPLDRPSPDDLAALIEVEECETSRVDLPIHPERDRHLLRAPLRDI